MLLLKIVTLTALLLGSNATPSCIFYGEGKTNLVCSSDDFDYILTQGLISNQDKVTSLSLRSCKITDIECGALTGLPALRNLNLAENKLQDFKPCISNNLQQLTSLNISFNRISALSPGAFENLHNLEELNLGGNQLKTLQPGVFDKLIKLNILDLFNNAIDGRNLNPSVFDNNKIITTLDLSRNDMSAAPDDLLQSFQTLHYLKLDRCFLTKVPTFVTKYQLKTMKQLILTTNQISSLDDATVFINLDNLELLNFAGNAIENIVENVFTPLRKLKTIVLKHNKLKTIPEKLFQNLPKLVNIDLSFNELEVINLASFRNTPMKNLNLSGNKLSYLPENFYDTLISSGGKLKKFLFTNNPWQCACLREILQEVKQHNVQYNSTVFDGNTSICVATDDYLTCKRG